MQRVLVVLGWLLGMSLFAGEKSTARATSAAPLADTASPTPMTDGMVILVTLDGARWQDVFGGAMPRLDALATTRGAALGAPGAGAPIVASGPNFVSLPGYTEIFSGAPSPCRSNDCGPVHVRTLFQDVADGGGEAAAFASWERFAWATGGDARVLVSAGRHGRAGSRADADLERAIDEAATDGPWPGEGDFRRDEATGRLALGYLARHTPRLLAVGLGEPDELAHKRDWPGYLAALDRADAFLSELVARLDADGRWAKTTLLVTADHGRAADFRHHGRAYPESRRVWLVALGRGISVRGHVGAPTERHLADIAPTARALLGLPARGAPLSELF